MLSTRRNNPRMLFRRIDARLRDALVWGSMRISTRLLLGTAVALVVTGAAVSSQRTPASRALAQTAKVSQANAAAEFTKLDAAKLPIIKKIPIGGDADWLSIGFGSVWVTVAKNNEVVRVDPARNVVQARIAVDKEPCYGIGIGVDRVWVLNCQSKTLTRIN
ncbi:MAG TPA: hypothetical protein VNB54_13665, partial [Alphaproteobacteria bacterium]|nr:hypothetical protein [Alphaproteobacteria bacterium]